MNPVDALNFVIMSIDTYDWKIEFQYKQNETDKFQFITLTGPDM